MPTNFPKSDNSFIHPADFQNNPTKLTYRSWEKIANEDNEEKKTKWQDTLKYILSYSYPEWATNKETGEKRIGKDGQPWRNRNWDPDYPHGYQIQYTFDEGTMTTGSNPLWRKFCKLQPQDGDVIEITRKGDTKEEMDYFLRKVPKEMKSSDLPHSQDVPF